jgi:tetratricopeptide (TPR) repeat protein
VERLIGESFVPIRIQVREHPEQMERFGVNWTPTILILDPEGQERHRIEGFLPPDDFQAQLLLGLGHSAFARRDFDEAERRFEQVLRERPESDAAAEAQYWRGVSRYKRSGDATELTAIYDAFQRRYRDTPWAKKASVWAPTAA